ncbi:MAG TPA: BrnT family toxin [Bordetella sp.]|uniref:BrnT family toxin n=1 Tax=Bordetella sp. TaxID=28081 RepID=UPI002ED652E1
MIDFDQISGFDWDKGNALKSASKYSVSTTEAQQVFFNAPLLVLEDLVHSRRELRLHALGKTDAGGRMRLRSLCAIVDATSDHPPRSRKCPCLPA